MSLYHGLKALGKEQRVEEKSSIGKWLEDRCHREHLSLRQAATKIDVSHATIGYIIGGSHPSAETIRKLANAFDGNGNQGLVLEDELLLLAGYRSKWPEQSRREELTESMAELMDKVFKFNESQIKMMTSFADFLAAVPEESERNVNSHKQNETLG